jgi:ribosomal peptide maturation radical SAM protein 1
MSNDIEILYVVAPFHSVERPAIGPHILQGISDCKGVSSEVFYSNMLLAKMVGIERYSKICSSQTSQLIGESFFAPDDKLNKAVTCVSDFLGLSISTLRECRIKYFEDTLNYILDKKPKILASSIAFQQINCILELNQRVKNKINSIITIVGSATITHDTSSALKHLTIKHYSDSIDYFFEGEAEVSYYNYLDCYLDKKSLDKKIVKSSKEFNLDDTLPFNYCDYFSQLNELLPDIDSKSISIPIETTRGCWHKLVSHCKFCGLNNTTQSYRVRDIKKTINLMSDLINCHGINKFEIIDSILPKNYFSDFFIDIKKLNISLFFELKPPINFSQTLILKNAGAQSLQAGIESLSTKLLCQMGKGTTLIDNVNLLRYCRIMKIYVVWNLLHGVPGETDDDYFKIQEIIHLIQHLNPPEGFYSISLVKNSPYFQNSDDFGISNIRPSLRYLECFADSEFTKELAPIFIGDYDRVQYSNPNLFNCIHHLVEKWRYIWTLSLPSLEVEIVEEGKYLLFDTRPIANKNWQFITENQAILVLFGIFDIPEDVKWAKQNGYVLIDNGVICPLATASIENFQIIERLANRKV